MFFVSITAEDGQHLKPFVSLVDADAYRVEQTSDVLVAANPYTETGCSFVDTYGRVISMFEAETGSCAWCVREGAVSPLYQVGEVMVCGSCADDLACGMLDMSDEGVRVTDEFKEIYRMCDMSYRLKEFFRPGVVHI